MPLQGALYGRSFVSSFLQRLKAPAIIYRVAGVLQFRNIRFAVVVFCRPCALPSLINMKKPG
jgi:hypothetical protein